jgi:hypothetical protein
MRQPDQAGAGPRGARWMSCPTSPACPPARRTRVARPAPAPPVINRCPVGLEQELRGAMMGSMSLTTSPSRVAISHSPRSIRVVRSGVERYQLVVSPWWSRPGPGGLREIMIKTERSYGAPSGARSTTYSEGATEPLDPPRGDDVRIAAARRWVVAPIRTAAAVIHARKSNNSSRNWDEAWPNAL